MTSTNFNGIYFETARQTREDFDNHWESALNDEEYRSSVLRLNEGGAASAELRAPLTSPQQQDSSTFKSSYIWWTQIWDGFQFGPFINFTLRNMKPE